MPSTLQEAFTDVQTITPVSPASKSLPSPCPYMNWPPARWHRTPVFYLRHGWVLIPHTSETPMAWTCADPLGEGLAVLWPCWLVPENSCATVQWFRVYGNCNPQPAPGFAALIGSLCSYASEWGSSRSPTESFVHGKANSPLSNALPTGELLLPEQPSGSLDCVASS